MLRHLVPDPRSDQHRRQHFAAAGVPRQPAQSEIFLVLTVQASQLWPNRKVTAPYVHTGPGLG
jgi:hypothetical protein